MTRPPRTLQFLRSIVFNFGMYLGTATIVIGASPLLLAPSPVAQAVSRVWARFCLGLLRLSCGLDHRVGGQQHLPARRYMVAAKHQSTWETLSLVLIVPGACFVLKRELLWIPFVGWFMARAGHIGVDRAAGAGALRKLLRQAERAVARGRTLVIFPEGTRAPIGTSLPYQPGVAALYSQLKLPVMPVALNSGVFWGRRLFIKWPGTIACEFLAPIAPGLKRDVFMAQLRARLDPNTDRLVAAAKTDWNIA